MEFTELAETGYETDEENQKSGYHKIGDDLCRKPATLFKRGSLKTRKDEFTAESSKAEGLRHRSSFFSMTAYDRHKQMINNYFLYYKGSTSALQQDRSRLKRDSDIVREHHQFLWESNEEAQSWEKRLAKKYYDKLYKEYCICDLRFYKENKVALRWRTEKELVEGKGQFSCGEKHCSEKDHLRTWEVNFAYAEHGQKKNALVKLRLCPDCSYKLNYHKKKKDITKKVKKPKHKKKKETYCQRKEESTAEDTTESTCSVELQQEQEAAEKEDLWSKTIQLGEKSREDEFDAYIEDLFL
ncbi:protein FRA10AC1-like [Artemia franciscana]|uniref:protein FRA10AC1-like n=1 Tax=Artemia franciscana TaxID=6661 RepID=UPI0032DB58D1